MIPELGPARLPETLKEFLADALTPLFRETMRPSLEAITLSDSQPFVVCSSPKRISLNRFFFLKYMAKVAFDSDARTTTFSLAMLILFRHLVKKGCDPTAFLNRLFFVPPEYATSATFMRHFFPPDPEANAEWVNQWFASGSFPRVSDASWACSLLLWSRLNWPQFAHADPRQLDRVIIVWVEDDEKFATFQAFTGVMRLRPHASRRELTDTVFHELCHAVLNASRHDRVWRGMVASVNMRLPLFFQIRPRASFTK